MDVDPEGLRDSILEVGGQPKPFLTPQPMCESVGLESVKTLVVKERLRVSPRRRVSRSRRQEIGTDRGADRTIVSQGVVNQVAKQDRGQFWCVQLIGQEHSQAVLQFLMPQNGSEQEAGQHGFALRLAPSLRPNLVPEPIVGAVGQVFRQFVH